MNFFFRELFLNVVFGHLRMNCEVVFFFFPSPRWERRFGFSSEPAIAIRPPEGDISHTLQVGCSQCNGLQRIQKI